MGSRSKSGPPVRLVRTAGGGYRTRDGRFVLRPKGKTAGGARAFTITDTRTWRTLPACELTACRLYIAVAIASEVEASQPIPPLAETREWSCYRPRR